MINCARSPRVGRDCRTISRGLEPSCWGPPSASSSTGGRVGNGMNHFVRIIPTQHTTLRNKYGIRLIDNGTNYRIPTHSSATRDYLCYVGRPESAPCSGIGMRVYRKVIWLVYKQPYDVLTVNINRLPRLIVKINIIP